MNLNLSNYPRIEIPEGRVKKITRKSDGFTLWSAGYINMVPLSIDTNGNVYNSTGYKEGYRLSSSQGESAQNNSVMTGFIPATRNDTIQMFGASWEVTPQNGYSYIMFYDENFNKIGTCNRYFSDNKSVSNITGIINSDKTLSSVNTDENGIITFNIKYTDNANFSYIRISAEGKGKDLIVAISEDIIV